MALPSPHMTPTTSPLQNDFPNLSLNGRQTEKCDKEAIINAAGGKRDTRER